MSLRQAVWGGLLLFLVLFLAACGGIVFPGSMLVHLAVGWLLYLIRVLPKVSVNPAGWATALVTLFGFMLGFHSLGRWLYSSWNSDPNAKTNLWSWRSTVSIAVLVVLLFIAGIAITGGAHQSVWLLAGPDPIISSNWQASERTQSKNNLKQIGLALHAFHDSHSSFPAGVTFDTYDGPLHGWETMLLPMLDQQPLFRRIDLSAPWNSDKNAEAFRTEMPVFLNPRIRSTAKRSVPRTNEPALTHYSGNAWALGDRPLRTTDIRDGAANTILAGEVAGNFAPWGKPMNVRDPKLGINKSANGFGSTFTGGCHVLLADGTVRFISENISLEVLNAVATPAGGEKFEGDGL